MDDSLEIIIYILFAVVSIIGSIYKNSAKKKEERRRREQMSMPEENDSPSSYERKEKPKTLEEFLMEQLEMESSSPNIPPVEEVIEENEIVQEQPKIANKKEEGAAVFNNTNKVILSDDMKDENFSITDALNKVEEFSYEHEPELAEDLEEIDLRKAVVYSEILNRPYE